jgi:hypothetical protein
MGIEELRSCEAQQKDWNVSNPARKVVDDVHERGLAVVNVFENKHQRLCPGDLREESAKSPQHLFTGDSFFEAERSRNAAGDGRSVVEAPDEPVDRA